MRPKAKYAVIHRHREEYPISAMYKFFGVSRSGYYNFTKLLGKPEKDADLAKIIQLCQDTTDKTYGYRRVWLWLKARTYIGILFRVKASVPAVRGISASLLSEIRMTQRKRLTIGMVVFGLLADRTSMRLLMMISGGLLILMAAVMFLDKSFYRHSSDK